MQKNKYSLTKHVVILFSDTGHDFDVGGVDLWGWFLWEHLDAFLAGCKVPS